MEGLGRLPGFARSTRTRADPSAGEPVSAHPTMDGDPGASPTFWALVREDLATNRHDWTLPGFQALLMYRIGNARPKGRLGAAVVSRLYRAAHVLVRNVYGIELHATARLGRRIMIAHQGGIVIHGQAVIGDDCIIRQNVTIGAANAASHGEAPVFGRNVEVGAGAVLVGKIRVGDHVRVGPNAVVMTSVPDHAMVFAPMSRVMPGRPT